MEFLRYRRNETPFDTLVEGIFPVRPGTSIVIEPEKEPREHQYYGVEDLFSATVPSGFDEASEVFGALLEDSVKLRLRSDVPVGICLSGGLDSSAITAAATSYGREKINTYSAVFPGFEADESRFSDAVVAKCNSRHHRTELTIQDFFDAYEVFVDAQDSPHPSPRAVARYYVLKEAAKDVTVVLDGQGGDEIFGGYDKSYQIYRKYYEKDAGKKLLMHVAEKVPYKSKVFKLTELEGVQRDEAAGIRCRIDEVIPSREPYIDRQYVILRNNLLSLLHTEDRLTMIHSIEGRVPLLNHRLVELCFSSPVSFKIEEYDKNMMRRWAKNNGFLSDDVVYRTDKKGFSTSFEEILRTAPESIEWFRLMFDNYLRKTPGVFKVEAVSLLLEELKLRQANNVNRLLSILSTLIYLHKNKLRVVD